MFLIVMGLCITAVVGIIVSAEVETEYEEYSK